MSECVRVLARMDAVVAGGGRAVSAHSRALTSKRFAHFLAEPVSATQSRKWRTISSAYRSKPASSAPYLER